MVKFIGRVSLSHVPFLRNSFGFESKEGGIFETTLYFLQMLIPQAGK